MRNAGETRATASDGLMGSLSLHTSSTQTNYLLLTLRAVRRPRHSGPFKALWCPLSTLSGCNMTPWGLIYLTLLTFLFFVFSFLGPAHFETYLETSARSDNHDRLQSQACHVM